jgi:hypothetical protein
MIAIEARKDHMTHIFELVTYNTDRDLAFDLFGATKAH